VKRGLKAGFAAYIADTSGIIPVAKHFLLMAGIALLAYSCSEHCPAFPAYYMDYFPYRTGDILRFANEKQDTLSFTVTKQSSTGSSSIDWNCDCACEAYHGFLAELNDTLCFGGSINGDGYFIDLFCTFNRNDEFSLAKYDTNLFELQNEDVLGRIITLENSNPTQISKLVIVKGKGVTEFFDTKLNCNWQKINE
jgi:hypothetical protein